MSDFSYMRIPSPSEGIHIDKHLFIVSADLGQTMDYTAISVIEKIIKGAGVLNEKHYHLRHIERPPRGTEYTSIAYRIMELLDSPQMGEHTKAVCIDLTGLGRPFYDLMIASGVSRSVLHAITITAGNAVTTPEHNMYGVPKRDLITNLQVMLQNGSLRIARGLKEADALTDELMNFKTKITESGRDVYGARSGAHDDIVLSVAMGAWLASREPRRAIVRDIRLLGI